MFVGEKTAILVLNENSARPAAGSEEQEQYRKTFQSKKLDRRFILYLPCVPCFQNELYLAFLPGTKGEDCQFPFLFLFSLE